MGYFADQKAMGIRIYGTRSWREHRRVILFTLRSLKNRKQIEEFHQYFADYKPLPGLLNRHFALEEDINRVFFYRGSTAAERLEKIKNHFDALPHYFKTASLQEMYAEDGCHGITLWKSDDLDMEARILYIPGQRKEGLLTLLLTIANQGLYHINFRLDKDNQTGKTYMLIGTLQGYKDGLDKAKAATKKMFGYRPKNFIFFLMRLLVKHLKIDHIEAISDYGFYTNNHVIRINRSKTTQFDPFWEELGGYERSDDKRFFIIPVEEKRTPIEDIKSQKRSQYRKRYALLDEYQEQIINNLKPHLL